MQVCRLSFASCTKFGKSSSCRSFFPRVLYDVARNFSVSWGAVSPRSRALASCGTSPSGKAVMWTCCACPTFFNKAWSFPVERPQFGNSVRRSQLTIRKRTSFCYHTRFPLITDGGPSDRYTLSGKSGPGINQHCSLGSLPDNSTSREPFSLGFRWTCSANRKKRPVHCFQEQLQGE